MPDERARGHRTPAFRLSGALLLLCGIVACASDGAIRPHPQIRDCPPGEVLICTGRGEPSQGGDEDIPQYERCHCRIAL